jgi:thymidylate synthase (FAD)
MGSDERIADAARVSYQKGTRRVSSDRGLIRYLMRHAHWTPFEMVEFCFAIKMPIFVIIQLLRHRTANINSESGRYSELKPEFYIPEVQQLKKQSKTNNQGRSNELVDNPRFTQVIMETQSADAHRHYKDYLDTGLAKELARINLPLSQYMSLYWKCDLRNIFNFLKLRLDSHAQYEIRVLAEGMSQIVKGLMPAAYEAFEDYILNSVTLSSEELKLIKSLVTEEELRQRVEDSIDTLTKREKTELLAKFGL